MAKTKTSFFCQSCGAQSPKWLGKCPSCGEWNTLAEEVVQREEKDLPWKKKNGISKAPAAHLLQEVTLSQEHRSSVSDNELNRVLGGGIVPGSVILLGGEPGIGKSTLMLQLALQQKKSITVYVSGEESEQQIRMRAERIGINQSSCYILTETSLENIFQSLHSVQPQLVIVDSVQTLHTSSIESSPGSVSQIRECASGFMRFAKETNTPVVLIGHITKDGTIAGPKVLEHMVDTVLQFEGDRHHSYRILRSLKNRFGSTAELGIYEMMGNGLREVSNPSEILLSQRAEPVSGIAIAVTMEGMRPLLIETQALVSSAVYGTPQRSSTGYDLRRLHMVLAVLEKRCGFRLAAKDVFLNIAGGIRVEDPAIDLAVICSVLSSNEDIPIGQKVCFCAEVGLSGEIRPVNRIEQRIAEAAKLGFEEIFISRYNFSGKKELPKRIEGIKVNTLGKVEEVFRMLFG